MFKLEDLEYARSIMREVEFPDEEFGSDGSYDVSDFEEMFASIINEEFYIACGVSKLVLIIKSLPFVIKIPFDGYWHHDYFDCDYFEFSYFECANDDGSGDYCLCELENTKAMQAAGFGCFVPNMMFLGHFHDHAVYIQEKVQDMVNYSGKISATPGSLLKVAGCQQHTSFRDDWLAKIYDLYGEDKWVKFEKWVYDNRPMILSDMHKGNYGVDMNGRPVIFDISGFRD